MELTQLNNSMNNLNHVSDVKNSFKPNNLENNKEVIEKYPSDKVDPSISSNKFLNDVSSNITKIANLQKLQSTVSNQLEITAKVIHTTDSAVNSNSIQLDDKQPEIKSLLDNFNTLSAKIKQPEISDETGIFFDGVLGAKPLSANEIIEATSQQRERLSQFNKEVSNEIQSLVENTKNTISTERESVETKVEFKNIDYAKESAQFNGSTLESVKGGILPSQANAFPAHSEQLLA